MYERIRSATMFALYQLTLFVGLLLLPVAVLARQVGVSLRFDRALRRLDEAYDEARQG